MVNILDVPAKDGTIVQVNQVEFEKPNELAERLGYTLDEFRRKFFPRVAAAENISKEGNTEGE